MAKARAKTARVRLCLDGDLLDEHARLTADLEQARKADEASNEPDRAPAIARQIVDLEERIAADEIEFVFRGMGRGRWRKLAADHPPTDEQRQAGADFDIETFPFEAMAGSLESPDLSADDLRQLHDEVLDEVQFSHLWGACLKANLGSAVTRPSSQAARDVLQNSRGKSASPLTLASVEASSSVAS